METALGCVDTARSVRTVILSTHHVICLYLLDQLPEVTLRASEGRVFDKSLVEVDLTVGDSHPDVVQTVKVRVQLLHFVLERVKFLYCFLDTLNRL